MKSLAAARHERELRQEDLAEVLSEKLKRHVPRSYVSLWEGRRMLPDTKLAKVYAKELGGTIEDFWAPEMIAAFPKQAETKGAKKSGAERKAGRAKK